MSFTSADTVTTIWPWHEPPPEPETDTTEPSDHETTDITTAQPTTDSRQAVTHQPTGSGSTSTDSVPQVLSSENRGDLVVGLAVLGAVALVLVVLSATLSIVVAVLICKLRHSQKKNSSKLYPTPPATQNFKAKYLIRSTNCTLSLTRS